jgi:hypothetical protein
MHLWETKDKLYETSDRGAFMLGWLDLLASISSGVGTLAVLFLNPFSQETLQGYHPAWQICTLTRLQPLIIYITIYRTHFFSIEIQFDRLIWWLFLSNRCTVLQQMTYRFSKLHYHLSNDILQLDESKLIVVVTQHNVAGVSPT